MPEAPYLREYDTRIPAYDRTPEYRRIRASTVKFCDAVGTHLICPRRACKREGGCADRDMRGLPFCWEHYRGMLRFLLCVAARLLGADGRPGAAGNEPRMPPLFGGQPLLAELAEAGLDLGALARPVADGPDDWDWEAIPEMRELFRELTGDGTA
ncbi:hypothetical protein [Enterovirga aerilata]|uniref:Uncharacterized protein n=1 Tax=Enterovirga aerilata TaxID=2730920 RepID=A0A849IF38_9HYPH|nr:hypothetical protein [Enterovirga sp. DB1703]NNM72503.1 hypothetical protein [Enterovirga sp. DB1703]